MAGDGNRNGVRRGRRDGNSEWWDGLVIGMAQGSGRVGGLAVEELPFGGADAEGDAAEAFGVGDAAAGALLSAAFGHSFQALGGGAGADLGLVFAEGGGLAADLGFGDFHEGVGALGTPEEGFAHAVGGQAFAGDLFGEVQAAPGVGEGGVQGGLSAVAVVAVGVGGYAVGVDAEDYFGLVAADCADDLAPVGVGVLQFAVAVAEEYDIGAAEGAGGVALFHLAGGGEGFGGEGAVAGALVAVGGHQDDDVGAGFGNPLGHRGAAAAFGVVRVWGYHQGAARGGGHQARLGGVFLVGVAPSVNAVGSAGHRLTPGGRVGGA